MKKKSLKFGFIVSEFTGKHEIKKKAFKKSRKITAPLKLKCGALQRILAPLWIFWPRGDVFALHRHHHRFPDVRLATTLYMHSVV